MKTWLWWSALWLAVTVIGAEFGASGSTRFILQVIAGVVFVLIGVLRLLYEVGGEIRRRERNESPPDGS